MIDWSHSTKNEREVIDAALAHYVADMTTKGAGRKRPPAPRYQTWLVYEADRLLDSLRGR